MKAKPSKTDQIKNMTLNSEITLLQIIKFWNTISSESSLFVVKTFTRVN